MDIAEGTEPAVSGRRQRNTDWTHDHHAELVAGLRAGVTVEQLAEDLDRTPGAIRSRAKLLLPPGTPRARGEYAVDVLRELLIDDPAYDWEAELAQALDRLGRRYWNAADTQRLLDAWDTSTPLQTIAAEFDVDEPQLIRQLLSLGLAKNRAEIVDRLGCEPGGIVDLWQRMAADRASAEVWVLTIHGMPSDPVHVSLHASKPAAELVRDQLLVPATSTDTGAATAWWCIAGRSPSFAGGETSAGEVTIGTGGSQP
ncbi:hypothetical protein ACIA49_38750 [Kribbella sp. NPDC051587]|uniref:hypothetical protein n=1 Tax=Kribbella sp. NPDC051587 TaxID=3364119 RepID=UPI00378CD852